MSAEVDFDRTGWSGRSYRWEVIHVYRRRRASPDHHHLAADLDLLESVSLATLHLSGDVIVGLVAD